MALIHYKSACMCTLRIGKVASEELSDSSPATSVRTVFVFLYPVRYELTIDLRFTVMMSVLGELHGLPSSEHALH